MGGILTQKEIDDLLARLETENVQPAQGKADDPAVRVYDFRRPDKFQKDQIRTIQMLHESFCRLLTTAFSGYFRTMTQVSLASVDQLTFGEFSKGMANPGVIAVVTLQPLKGNAVIEISPNVALSMVDRLLGGGGVYQDRPRALTEIEQVVVERVIDLFLQNLREVWRNIVTFTPRVEGLEANPLFAQVVAVNEICVLVSLVAKVGESQGQINLCLPYITLERVLPRLSARHWFASGHEGAGAGGNLATVRHLDGVPVPISCDLGGRAISVRELLALRTGDVLELGGVEGDLPVYVGDKLRFRGKPGTVGNRLAVQITAVVPPQEDETHA